MALTDPAKTAKPKRTKQMNDKTYASASSARRAAKKALGHDNFETITNDDGSFSWIERTERTDADREASIEAGLARAATPSPADLEEQGPPAEILEAGDNAANGLQVTEAEPTGKAPVNVKRKSDIEKPTKRVWSLAEAKLAAEPTIRRKDMVDYLVGCGIAFYTARTQYQLYLTAVKDQAASK